MLDQLVAALRQLEFVRRQGRLLFAVGRQTVLRKDRRLDRPLHIVYVLNIAGMCGGTKIILEHARHLKDLGVEVTLVCHFPPPDWYPVTGNFLVIPFEIELARGIPDCDVIVATYWDHIQACVETGIAPVVYFEQGDFHLYDWQQDKVCDEIKDTVKRQYNLPFSVMTVSGTVAGLIKTKFKRDAAIVHNALDDKIFYPKDNAQYPDKRYMLVVGREQTRFKGIDDLKKVHSLLKEKGYDIELLWLTQQAPLSSAGQVIVNPPPESVGQLYRKAFVYVCGSYYEAFPLPPLEAMACGTPVVTTRNIGVLEYAKDGVNCLMAEAGDIMGLADKVEQLLTNPQLYGRLQQEGYKTAARFGWKQIAGGLLAYYEKMAGYCPVSCGKADEWDVNFRDEDFVDAGAAALVNKFLTNTAADRVWFPLRYKFLPGRDMIFWQVMATRKRRAGGYAEQIYFHLKGDKFLDSERLLLAALYQEGNFSDCLRQAQSRLNTLMPQTVEWAAAARWQALCLLELERYEEIEAFLAQALAVHPFYTDLWYVKAVLNYLKGNSACADDSMNICRVIGDAVFYPEHFADLRGIACEYLRKEKDHD